MTKRKDDDPAPFEEPTGEEAAPDPVAIDPMAVMLRLTMALEALTARQDQTPNDHIGALMEKLSDALVRVSESNIEGAKLITEENRKSHRPSNTVIPNVSVFNRRGELLPDYQKPKLKCLMMIPWLIEWESVTREEVELLNLLEAGSYSLKRIDRTKINVDIKVEYKTDNVTPSRLLMNHETAFNNDNFTMMPPLADMLRDILKQHDRQIARAAQAVLTDEEEEALIEAGELSVSA